MANFTSVRLANGNRSLCFTIGRVRSIVGDTSVDQDLKLPLSSSRSQELSSSPFLLPNTHESIRLGEDFTVMLNKCQQ